MYDINDYGDMNGAPWNDFNGAYDPEPEPEEWEHDEEESCQTENE